MLLISVAVGFIVFAISSALILIYKFYTTRIQLVVLEGNIGAGKSTLLKIIKDNIPNIHTVLEPVDQWQADGLFKLYYKNRIQYGYLFQSYVLTTRMEAILRKIRYYSKFWFKKSIILIERSGIADITCFAEIMHNNGELSDLEYFVIKRIYKYCYDEYKILDNSKVIYLHTPPMVCKNRVDIRKRNGEEGIKYEYLEDLDKYHNKNLLDEWNGRKEDVLVINGNKDYVNNDKEKEKLINQISKFIL